MIDDKIDEEVKENLIKLLKEIKKDNLRLENLILEHASGLHCLKNPNHKIYSAFIVDISTRVYARICYECKEVF